MTPTVSAYSFSARAALIVLGSAFSSQTGCTAADIFDEMTGQAEV